MHAHRFADTVLRDSRVRGFKHPRISHVLFHPHVPGACTHTVLQIPYSAIAGFVVSSIHASAMYCFTHMYLVHARSVLFHPHVPGACMHTVLQIPLLRLAAEQSKLVKPVLPARDSEGLSSDEGDTSDGDSGGSGSSSEGSEEEEGEVCSSDMELCSEGSAGRLPLVTTFPIIRAQLVYFQSLLIDSITC